MSLSQKNFQGFVMLGLDFATNYGEEIYACCQFNYRGYEISVSTGATNSASRETAKFPSPILVTHIATGVEHSINGSVEDAIEFVNKQ